MALFVRGFNQLIFDNSAGSDIKAGEVVSLNSNTLVGVAPSLIPSGGRGVVSLDGVWEIETGSTFSCTQGAPAYWDDTNKVIVAAVPSGSTYPVVGVFAQTLTASKGSVDVILGVIPKTETTSS